MIAPRIAYVVAALLILAPLRLQAQQQPPVGPGDRVRVWAASAGIEGSVGTVLALRPDTIVVGNGEPLVLAISSLTRLEVSRDRQSRAGIGGIIGLVGGTVTGVVIAISTYDVCGFWDTDCDANKNREAAYIPVVAGALVGYGVGVLIGSTIKVDRWEEVPLHRLRVTVLPQRGGVLVVSASIRL